MIENHTQTGRQTLLFTPRTPVLAHLSILAYLANLPLKKGPSYRSTTFKVVTPATRGLTRGPSRQRNGKRPVGLSVTIFWTGGKISRSLLATPGRLEVTRVGWVAGGGGVERAGQSAHPNFGNLKTRLDNDSEII